MKISIQYLLLLFLVFLSCHHREPVSTPTYGTIGSVLYISFSDSLGDDYLMKNHLKANHLKIVNVLYETDTFNPPYIWNNNHYLFRINIVGTATHILIGQHVKDTLQIDFAGSNYYEMHDEHFVDPYFGDTIEKFTLLKEVYYNNRRLAPPQFDADGNVHVHRIAVREDF